MRLLTLLSLALGAHCISASTIDRSAAKPAAHVLVAGRAAAARRDAYAGHVGSLMRREGVGPGGLQCAVRAAERGREIQLTAIRSDGVLSSAEVIGAVGKAVSFAKVTVHSLAIAGMAAAPLFIMLDITNGDYVGGAFGAAGLVLGIAGIAASTLLSGIEAMSAAAGPVGWLIGAASAFFNIMPMMWMKHVKLPKLDATEVIQYVMFGDPDHTGNEKCRQGQDGQPGNPNCTAVYGPGIIGKAFGWDNFDPIVFMLRFNLGYSMTIPDMAKSFCVTGHDNVHPETECAGQPAVIRCEALPPCTNARFCTPEKMTVCRSPRFELRRDLIVIPTVNQTAEQVYRRVIPQPGGDCTLISDVTEAHYASLNLTVSGMPVAIACGISAAFGPSGSLLNQTDPRGHSTDGLNHDPPPMAPSPFGQIDASDSVCLGSDAKTLCLPSGAYDAQSGKFGFSSKDANSLTMPAGASFNVSFRRVVHGKGGRMGSTELKPEPVTLSANHSSSTPTWAGLAFSDFMQHIAGQSGGGHDRFQVTLAGPEPAAVCLFTKTGYAGDVACYGPGGANLTDGMQEAARSLRLSGGARAWIFPDHYGDEGGHLVVHSYPDLSAIDDGAKLNFAKNVKAMLVVDENARGGIGLEGSGGSAATNRSAPYGVSTNTDGSSGNATVPYWSSGNTTATYAQGAPGAWWNTTDKSGALRRVSGSGSGNGTGSGSGNETGPAGLNAYNLSTTTTTTAGAARGNSSFLFDVTGAPLDLYLKAGKGQG